jgi:acyl carrier protein
MVTIAVPAAKTMPAYPTAEVTAVLRDELVCAIRRRFRRKGTPLPTNDDEVVILTIEIDSLTVVELLSSLDDILPFQITESVVKAGGYSSIAAAVKHVTGRVENKWIKYHGGGKA